MHETIDHSMRDKVCLITGSTSGIGQETALGLARMGATVVMVGRDPARGAAARAAVVAGSGNENVTLLVANLASQQSVRDLAAEFQSRFDRLDVLVNNAGQMRAHRETTVDGLEYTFALNHLAPFLLTNLLRDRLTQSAPARVVTVSSMAHGSGKIHWDDLQFARRFSMMGSYAQSKLANVMFTYELDRRLAGTGVTANCLHPGVVASRFGQTDGGFIAFGMRVISPVLISSAKGARTSIYLASSPEVAGVTGQYFVKCKPVRSTKESYDIAACQRLWEISERLTGLTAMSGASA